MHDIMPCRAHPPLRMFLTGGAGVGKSFIITILREFLVRAHRGVLTKPVMLMAPTGVAASNIAARTLHTALNIPVENVRPGVRQRLKYTALSGHKLQMARALWDGVRYIILDEVSMVSYDTLGHMHKRLGEITGVTHMPFGGLSVISVGDLFQLPPVKAE
jgi:hypothetical protein